MKTRVEDRGDGSSGAPRADTLLTDTLLTDTLGRPLRDLRISVTDRCNFRCDYCMPAEIFGDAYEFLPRADILTFEEIERLVGVMAPLGVRKVRITGGEPLLRHGLHHLVQGLDAIEGIDDIALTTNASLLERMAGQLLRAGLTRMTVSLDSLDPDVFLAMNGGRLTVQEVFEGIATAERVGFGPLKINCVVQKGVNDHTLLDLARHFKGTGHILRFIEYMDVGTRNDWDLSQVLPAAELVRLIAAELPIEPVDPNYTGEVARRWRYKDGEGEIGIITSVSQPFCRDCSRARLTTDGQLVTCLFASGGTDLRGPLRQGASDGELRELVASVWGGRTDRYSEERTARMAEGKGKRERLEMYQIGG
ncbi:MAG: GTP 3',8-cyclase MoaA [Deltaproteobacteria bacterium]|nr:GTP 3',8-cyclase MoaA [Deltaproteobacteria bacterium]MBW2421335.1 GTP 3',8-cyclase MoaA [Deltaproteobacteria bacterium]